MEVKPAKKINVHCLLLLFYFFISYKVFSTDFFTENTSLVPLDTGAFAYIIADVQEADPIINIIPIDELKNWQAVLVRQSTNTAVAALFAKESGRRYQIAGWGNYPSFRAGTALFFSPSWRRQRTEAGSYWYSRKDRLSVTVSASQVFAVSWHNNHVDPMPSGSGVSLTDDFIEFRNARRMVAEHGINWNAPVSCWMDQPALLLNKIFTNEDINIDLPLNRLFFKLYVPVQQSVSGQFRVSLQMQFNNEAQARNAMTDLARAGNVSQANTSVLTKIFFANPPIQTGRNITINTAVLTDEDVLSIFQLFLLIWE